MAPRWNGLWSIIVCCCWLFCWVNLHNERRKEGGKEGKVSFLSNMSFTFAFVAPVQAGLCFACSSDSWNTRQRRDSEGENKPSSAKPKANFKSSHNKCSGEVKLKIIFYADKVIQDVQIWFQCEIYANLPSRISSTKQQQQEEEEMQLTKWIYRKWYQKNHHKTFFPKSTSKI